MAMESAGALVKPALRAGAGMLRENSIALRWYGIRGLSDWRIVEARIVMLRPHDDACVQPRGDRPARAEAGSVRAGRDLARVGRSALQAVPRVRIEAERDPHEARRGRSRGREPGVLGDPG